MSELRTVMPQVSSSQCCGIGGNPNAVAMTCRSPESPHKQHFRRSCSRVYYASENGCWPAHSLPRDFWKRSRTQKESGIQERGEETLSSGEDAVEGEFSLEGLYSGSLRGSPSQRSQDSGYSDSGESTVALQDSDSSTSATPPSVKHITRIYFGENLHLFNDKIVCTSASGAAVPARGLAERSGKREGRWKKLDSFQRADLEELAEELEHKSVLEIGLRHSVTAVKWNDRSSVTLSKRPQRCNSSVEKATPEGAEGHPGRPATGNRTRRRWSMGEVQPAGNKHRRPSQHAVAAAPTSAADRKCNPDLVTNLQPWSLTGSGDLLQVARRRDNSELLPPSADAGDSAFSTAALAQEMRNASLQQWVKELRVLYEAECMNTLQSKSVPRESAHHDPPAHCTRDAVHAIQHRAQDVSTEFAKLCQRLEWLELDQVPVLAKSLMCHINTFLKDYTTQWTSAEPDFQPQSSLGRQSKVIEQICQRLTDVCSDDHALEADEQDTTRQVVQVVTALGHAFTKLVDLMISREIKVVVAALEGARSEKEVSSAVSHLTALGVDGGHICRLIARLGGVRALLSLCLEPRLRQVRVASLRALATVCCVVEGIVELEKAGGVEVVAEVLCDEECPEEERSEAAGVLAQVTSPWVEDNHRLAGLHDNMDAIVAALTGLAEQTRSAEIFLLASAALANLTFLDGGCVGAMRRAGTARVLLRAARGNPSISIFTKDQIATVLANLAGSRGAAEEVVAAGGVSVLLSLLNTRPAPSHRLPEVATAERVQQKSAIALSRLCGDGDVARKVAQQGGAERLVQLCKDEGERNQSDAVLVACLAALRKMASSLGSDELRDMDAAELVEPRLLDSFLIYSSRQESYV
ncbi:protein inscuteable homolog [Penaeus japonicus]|uniref:protein inscuteable homolog n=1 Tax=Penaeus japonicus TaxID=27405 RepID=UPI001C7151C5|nr:protein inscuteable homolog [Penaeus japonicus]